MQLLGVLYELGLTSVMGVFRPPKGPHCGIAAFIAEFQRTIRNMEALSFNATNGHPSTATGCST